MKNFKDWNNLNENKFMDRVNKVLKKKDPKPEVDKTTDLYRYEKRLVGRLKEMINKNKNTITQEGTFFVFNDLKIAMLDKVLPETMQMAPTIELPKFNYTFKTLELFKELNEYIEEIYKEVSQKNKDSKGAEDLDKLKRFMDY
tara:strand:- start:19349 stop:19777 length:429 start_codon:yes stop_codon:yes gene_type:complete